MDNQKQINLYKIFSSFIVLRQDVRVLKEKILKKKLNSVVFNFDGIEFISRSATHEFNMIKKELSEKGVNVVFEKMSPDIEKIIKAVANPKGKKTKFKLKRVSLEALAKNLIN